MIQVYNFTVDTRTGAADVSYFKVDTSTGAAELRSYAAMQHNGQKGKRSLFDKDPIMRKIHTQSKKCARFSKSVLFFRNGRFKRPLRVW